jgi:hypothetical protein
MKSTPGQCLSAAFADGRLVLADHWKRFAFRRLLKFFVRNALSFAVVSELFGLNAIQNWFELTNELSASVSHWNRFAFHQPLKSSLRVHSISAVLSTW